MTLRSEWSQEGDTTVEDDSAAAAEGIVEGGSATDESGAVAPTGSAVSVAGCSTDTFASIVGSPLGASESFISWSSLEVAGGSLGTVDASSFMVGSSLFFLSFTFGWMQQ
jgi:hypothetical protein